MEASTSPEETPAAQPLDAPAAIPIAYASAPPKPAPIAPGDRIESLDVLRGVAVLGILLMNIYSFSFLFWEYSPSLWPTLEGLDATVTLALRFFVGGKFLTIFSLLFGAGLALQSGRAAARGTPFVGMYSRRLAILYVIGLFHGILIWHGDILALYAIIGFVAMFLRNLRPWVLLILATLFFMVPIFFSILWSIHEHSMLAFEPEYAQPGALMQRVYELFNREEEILSSGTYGEATLLRLAISGWEGIFISPQSTYGMCLALFLLGIVLVRKGILSRPAEHKVALQRFVLYGFGLGIVIQIVDNYLLYIGELPLWLDIIHRLAYRFGPLCMSLAYVGVIVLMSLWLRGSILLRPLASVGRTALTNYIAQSIICTTIFYGYGIGFGLFGTLSRAQALGAALCVIVAQLVISPLWLRFFRYGPLEWLWRTLTYMQVQPMRKRRPAREPT